MEYLCFSNHYGRLFILNWDYLLKWHYSPLTAAFEKKIKKAIAAYAPISSTETPMLMEDFTLFGSAKEGFVWTNEKIYIKEMFEPKVSFSFYDVKEVRCTEKSNALYYIELVTAGKAYTISMRSTAADAQKTTEFYNDVLMLFRLHYC